MEWKGFEEEPKFKSGEQTYVWIKDKDNIFIASYYAYEGARNADALKWARIKYPSIETPS